jgi:hypothetical protein
MSEPGSTAGGNTTADGGEPGDLPRRTLRVPIRRGASPFAQPEYAEVEPNAAGQWSLAVWHNEPPG